MKKKKKNLPVNKNGNEGMKKKIDEVITKRSELM